MKVNDYNTGYAVVQLRYWNEYKEDAYVERWFNDIDEAVRNANSLTRNDGIFFIVVSCVK